MDHIKQLKLLNSRIPPKSIDEYGVEDIHPIVYVAGTTKTIVAVVTRDGFLWNTILKKWVMISHTCKQQPPLRWFVSYPEKNWNKYVSVAKTLANRFVSAPSNFDFAIHADGNPYNITISNIVRSPIREYVIGRTYKDLFVKAIRSKINCAKKKPYKFVEVLCECALCGTTKWFDYARVRNGSITNCGCSKPKHKAITHGLTGTRLYHIWDNMRQRCYNRNKSKWKNYGGRLDKDGGPVTVCDEWNTSSSAFFDWALSHGYRDDLTLERIDVLKGYSPSNCKWVSNLLQQRNKRDTCQYMYRGTMTAIATIAEDLTLPYTTIKQLYNKGQLGKFLERLYSQEKQLASNSLLEARKPKYEFVDEYDNSELIRLTRNHIEYIVTIDGFVWDTRAVKWLKLKIRNDTGMLYVNTWNHNSVGAINIAHELAKHFIPNSENFKNLVFKDTDKTNIALENMCWSPVRHYAVGKEYGRLTVKRLVRYDNKIYAYCMCTCGNTRTVIYSDLIRGALNPSCGCLQRRHPSNNIN